MRTGLLYGLMFGAGTLFGTMVVNHWAVGALAATLVTLLAVLLVLPAEIARKNERELAKRRISSYGNYQSTVHLGKNTPRKHDRYDIFSDAD